MAAVRLLLLGASGQLGRCLRDRIPGHWQVGLPTHGELDISDRAAVVRYVSAFRPHLIINAAAYNAVDRAETDSASANAVNAAGAGNIAQAARRAGARMIHISTDYVFDGANRLAACDDANAVLACVGEGLHCTVMPYAERDMPNPCNRYGESKRAGEVRVLGELPDAIVLRTAWLYSEYGHNFLRTMLRLAPTANTGKPAILRVVNDQIGCPTYAGDLADALIVLCRRMSPGALPVEGGIYHYCGTQPMSWYAFARRIFELRSRLHASAMPEMEPIDSQTFGAAASRPPVSAMSCTRIQSLGIQTRDLDASLRHVLSTLSPGHLGQ